MTKKNEKESVLRIGDKMDVRKIVWIAIMFIVGFVYFLIVRFIRLPHLKVFIYALPPHGLFVGAYNTIKGLLLQISGIIFGFFIAMTGVNFVLKYVPVVGHILRKIPPIPQLEQFGIFALIEGIFGAIFSLLPIKDRILRVLGAFATYIAVNTNEFVNLLGLRQRLAVVQANVRNHSGTVKNAISDNLPGGEKSRQERLERNKKRNQFNPRIQPSQFRKMDDEYRQCVEENIISPTPGLSPNELRGIDSRNVISRTVCKTKYLNSYLDAFRN